MIQPPKHTSPVFILIVGPPAVGKMSVGQQLADRLDYILFHNHHSIDYTLQFFGWGSAEFKMINEGIRQLMFDTALQSKNIKGFIFTLVWAFDSDEDWAYVEDLKNKFVKEGWRFITVELYADLQERLVRNESANRLVHKPSKRNLQASKQNLLELESSYQMSSRGLLESWEEYLFIDNSQQNITRACDKVITSFRLKEGSN